MLSEKEELIVELLDDKKIDEQTIVAVIHAMDTHDKQEKMISYLQNECMITKDSVLSMVKKIVFSDFAQETIHEIK